MMDLGKVSTDACNPDIEAREANHKHKKAMIEAVVNPATMILMSALF